MAGNVANLLVGPVQVYRAPEGTALPEVNNLAVGVITITPGSPWVDLGFTNDDHELTRDQDVQMIEVNQHIGPVEVKRTSETGSFAFSVSEHDLTAYSYALGDSAVSTVAAGADQTAQDRLGVGGGTLTKHAYLLVGTSPEGGSRVVKIHRGVITGSTTFANGKEWKGTPVEITILHDPTQSAGHRLWSWYDITDDATS